MGSPSWTLVTSFLCLLLVPYPGRENVCSHLPKIKAEYLSEAPGFRILKTCANSSSHKNFILKIEMAAGNARKSILSRITKQQIQGVAQEEILKGCHWMGVDKDPKVFSLENSILALGNRT